MIADQLVYWLNGFFELSGATTLNEEQVKVIKEHIALVLHKVTPSTVGPATPTPPQPQQTRGPYTFPVYPDPSMPWYKPWEITCVAGDSNINIPLKGFNPFVDPSKTQVMGTTVNVSEDMVQDLKAFTGVDLNLPTCECHGTKLTIPPFEEGITYRKTSEAEQSHLCKDLEAKDLPIINVTTCLTC